MMASSLQGKTLGKYRVLELLGRGGMARVYRGYHPRLDRYVAIKVLLSDLLEEQHLARFQREARAVAALRHPNVVQVFDFDGQDELYYIVMELLEGHTLKTRLNDYRTRRQRMPWGETARVLLDALNGLAYAHGQGMIHRDIKPSNILLTRHGQAVLGDFGIAQIVGETRHTAPGALMGTLSYVAPEQGMEGRSDARSDVYSLGVVLYEMLTQRAPFEADTPLAVLMKHVGDPPPPPRAIDPAIPQPFERIALKALAKAPDERYQSAEGMARALREAAAEVRVELPARISLPPSSASAQATLEEPAAVLSGSDREAIDARLAGDETHLTSGEQLARGAADRRPTSRSWSRSLMARSTQALHEAADAIEGDVRDLSPALRALARDLAPSEERRALWRRLRPIAYTLGLTLAINAAIFSLAGLTGWWAILDVGWPMEFFFVAGVLSSIVAVLHLPLLLGPVAFLACNGLLFFYTTATGNWEHWIFLSILDLILLGACVWLTLWLGRNKTHARRLGRTLGRPLALILVSAGLVVLSLSVALSLLALFRPTGAG